MRRALFPVTLAAFLLMVVFAVYLGVRINSHNPPTPSPTPSEIADSASCLTGHWVLTKEDTRTATSHLTGLQGATLDVAPGGLATWDYHLSQPAKGTINSQPASLVMQGRLLLSFRVTGTESMIMTNVSDTAFSTTTVNGVAQPRTQLPVPAPTTAAFSCRPANLNISVHAKDLNETYDFIRGGNPHP